MNRIPAFLSLLLLTLPATAQGPPAAHVELEEALLEDMAPRAWVSGTVVSRDDARLAAEIPGRLVEVADIGTAVKRGAVLARIDTGPLELQRRRDEASIRRLKRESTISIVSSSV